MTETVVLDSFTLASLFHKEQGWRKVRDILQSLLSEGQKAQLCLISWGEVYCFKAIYNYGMMSSRAFPPPRTALTGMR